MRLHPFECWFFSVIAGAGFYMGWHLMGSFTAGIGALIK